MALEAIDKIKITTFIRKHAYDDIYISDFFDGVKANKYSEKDILNYLIDFVNERLNEKCKERITYNYLNKLINVIHTLLVGLEETNNLPNDLLNKINNIKNNYTNCSFIKKPSDDDLENILNELISILENHKETPEETSSLNEYNILKEKIIELSSLIETKNQEIKELESLLKKATKEKDKTNKKLNNNLDELEKKNKTITELQTMVDSLNKEIQLLQDKCDKLVQNNRTIPLLQSNIQKQKETLNNLKHEIVTLKKKEKASKEEQELKEQSQKDLLNIDNYIFQLLCQQSLSLSDINKELINKGMFKSKEDIVSSLKRIQTRVNIMNQVRQIPVKYGICSPVNDINLKANINVPDKSYNMLLVSDMHLSAMDSNVLYGLDSLYDYAVQNNIDLIVNLGDLIDGKTVKGNNIETIKLTENLLEEIAYKFPKDHKINHALLGGNHDKLIFPYGIDPIKKICDMRDDFIYLGYDHAQLYLNKSILTKEDKPNNYLLIHHPNFRANPQLLDDDNINRVNTYLTSIYEQNDLNKNRYIDILGHFHKSSLDIINGVCVVPSYFDDRVCNGAWHLKIFFDKDNNIDHIVFIPLICSNKLIASSEVSYKKILKSNT